MDRPRRFFPPLLALALAGLLASPPVRSAPAPGEPLGDIVTPRATYRDARLKSIDARSLVFTHAGGLASLRLRDLPPDLQARLGYDPASAPPEPAAPPVAVAVAPVAPRPASPPAPPVSGESSVITELFQAFDRAPDLRPKQSLQAEFIELGLSAKNQGRRPSCAIFAVVSALEYQSAALTGSVERLSEEYLIWATLRGLGRADADGAPALDAETGEPIADAGFTLPSVIAAIQTYGTARADEFRNDTGRAHRAIPAPPDDLVARARARPRALIVELPGGTPEARLARVVHALNAGLPVPAGLRWPNERAIRAGFLADQTPAPGARHAVTIIGYECPTGRAEDAVFVFKNSYGPRWGLGGYGRAAWRYLARHLEEAYVLDVRPAPASPRS